MAIKNAREMALLPYTSRVTQQRGGRERRDDRAIRADGPLPRPTAPPPLGGPGDGEEAYDGEEAENDVLAAVDAEAEV